MATDDRDVLELLKAELNFLEKGGYGQSVKKPWLTTSMFQDSPSCACYPLHDHQEECALMQFVPPAYRTAGIPCHFIQLDSAGDTPAALESQGDQAQLEETVKRWLRETIKRLEAERAA